MKHTLDPHMFRDLSLEETCRKAAELGYDHVELSPRPDFLSWWTRPKVYPERVRSFKKALKDHGVGLAVHAKRKSRKGWPDGRALRANLTGGR